VQFQQGRDHGVSRERLVPLLIGTNDVENAREPDRVKLQNQTGQLSR
jgi:hypothetical protein